MRLVGRDASRVQPTVDAGEGFGRHFQLRQLAALERHGHPAGDRRVAVLTGLITPTSQLRILRLHDEVEGPLGGFAEFRILRHSVGFAEGDGRQGVRVQLDEWVRGRSGVDEHHALVVLVQDQVIQSGLHVGGVLKILVVIASALKRQQRQSGGCSVGLDLNLFGVETFETPAAVGELVSSQEAEPQLDRSLGLGAGSACPPPGESPWPRAARCRKGSVARTTLLSADGRPPTFCRKNRLGVMTASVCSFED